MKHRKRGLYLMNKEYNLGLLTSPSAVGHVQVDNRLNIMEPTHHQKAIGVYKFGEGETAENRRLHRSNRRSLRRKKARINYLNQEFAKGISTVDPCFFDRIKQSGLSPLDKNKQYRTIIFDRPNAESYYHKKFPTVYHLEKYLMTTDDKADIRLIYQALHSLLSNRGHFYNTTPLSQFKPGKIDLKKSLTELNGLSISDLSFALALKHVDHILKTLTSKKLTVRKKASNLQKFFLPENTDKSQLKQIKKSASQFVSGLLGSKFSLDQVFGLQLDKDAAKSYHFSLDDPMLDDKLADLTLDDKQARFVEIMQELFASLALNDILNGNDNLVDARIESYDKHKRDRNLFFKYANSLPEQECKLLIASFTLYIGNRNCDLLSARKLLGISSAKNYALDDFYKVLAKSIKKHSNSIAGQKIAELMRDNTYLVKQRNNLNVYVPYQLNALTFNVILQNQGKFYPFLVKENPSAQDRKNAPYKLSQLMQFTIPYYVGPLKTPLEAKHEDIAKNHCYSWLVRKAQGAITPWNFYDKVDIDKTADAFIKRNIARDTYLLSELVLPDNSLLYQKYKVLNELSNIAVNGKKLTGKLKQILLNQVFKKHSIVSKKMVISKLAEYNVNVMSLTGLSDLSKNPKFSNGLTTYYSWSKIFPQQIDNSQYRADLEQMIEWSTVFEDRSILKRKLKTIDWLTDRQRQFVVNQRLTGWGRLSQKLLTGLTNHRGQTIMQVMESTSKNFMQVINMQEFKEQIDRLHFESAKKMTVDDLLANSFTSPVNKKAVRMTLKILHEYIELNHGQKPSKIFLTFERSKEDKAKLTENRVKKLKQIYSQIDDPLLTNDLRNDLCQMAKDTHYQFTPKQFAYFKQLGHDGLTGEAINLHDLANYNLLHIIPRQKLIDNSRSNLILTKIKAVPDSISKIYANHKFDSQSTMLMFWRKLQKLGLISKGELGNLQTDLEHLSPYSAHGYEKRQLVAHNQIIKLIATILQKYYPEIKVIEVRHSQIEAIRYQFDYYRLKEVNDYYRGFDAYLASVIGQYLYTVYPRLRPLFVYGQYMKHKSDQEETDKIDYHSFNYLWRLLYGKDNDLFVNHSAEFAFKRNDLLDKMKTVYNYKFQHVVLKPKMHYAQLFKETLLPRHDRDTAKNRSLIAKKRNLPIEIYGGYTNNVDSYMALVQLKHKNKDDFIGFFGIPARNYQLIEENPAELHEVVENVLKRNKRKYDSFHILKSKVPFKQLVLQDGGKKFLASSGYGYNARQLILSSTSQKALMDLVYDPQFLKHRKTNVIADADSRLTKVYQELVKEIADYMPVFTVNRNISLLQDGLKVFPKLGLQDKINLLKEVITMTQVNSSSSSLPELGSKTARSFQVKFAPCNKSTVLVYQSPTGLKESRVKITDLI